LLKPKKNNYFAVNIDQRNSWFYITHRTIKFDYLLIYQDMPEFPCQKDLYQKLQSFCSYRERSTFEVSQKLKESGVNIEKQKQIIDKLKEEGFVDDRRFVETYVRSKLFNNHWGKVKTELHLKQLNIPEDLIAEGLGSVDGSEYQNILKKVISKKNNEIADTNVEIKKHKIARYCIQKGFEPSLVWSFINDIK